jgi:hypothetical protein
LGGGRISGCSSPVRGGVRRWCSREGSSRSRRRSACGRSRTRDRRRRSPKGKAKFRALIAISSIYFFTVRKDTRKRGQGERISANKSACHLRCDAAHVHCWVVVSGVTYKSNTAVIKAYGIREGAANMKNTKLHVGRTRRDIATLAVWIVSRNPYGVSVL